MPMTFGTSCESDSSHSQFGRKKRQQKERKPLPEKMDAFDRIIQLVSVRERSVAELRERLTKDTYPEEATEQALQRAIECGLIDDMRFADSFVRGRVSAGKGVARIVQDLQKHDIVPETLAGWPDAYLLDDESQYVRALEFLEANPPKAKDAWAAAYRKLMSRGYTPAIASRASRAWAEGLVTLQSNRNTF